MIHGNQEWLMTSMLRQIHLLKPILEREKKSLGSAFRFLEEESGGESGP